jgi:fido (protein-threonine AMPylation protein)
MQRQTPDADLAEFVAQSNRIEGEPDAPGHPLYDDHLSVARGVAARPEEWLDPLGIHRRLMASQPGKFPGELRQVGVSVGGRLKMGPAEVRGEFPALLAAAAAAVPEDPEGWCWGMHHRLEWVHPFWDGNGRTGRLWMNALRLTVGLRWLTVRYEDRFAYYRSIEEWEAQNAARPPGRRGR